MVATRRKLRRINAAQRAPFDDQLWPIGMALALLGSLLAAIVLQLCTWDQPGWWLRPTPWLVAIGAAMLVAMLVAWRLGPRFMRRGVQLSIVLSLLANCTMLLSMAKLNIFSPPRLDPDQIVQRQRERPEVIIPDYVRQSRRESIERRRDFERPVEAGTPESELDQITKQSSPKPDIPKRPQPEEVVDPAEEAIPNRLARQPLPESRPRQLQTESQLSRSQAKPTMPQPSTIKSPDLGRPTSEQESRQTEPRPLEVARRQQQIEVNRAETEEIPVAGAETTAVEVTRNDPTEQPEFELSGQAPQRQSQAPQQPITTAVEAKQLASNPPVSAKESVRSLAPTANSTQGVPKKRTDFRLNRETPRLETTPNIDGQLVAAIPLGRPNDAAAPKTAAAPPQARSPRARRLVPSAPSVSVKTDDVRLPETADLRTDAVVAAAATTSVQRADNRDKAVVDPQPRNTAELSALSTDLNRSSKAVGSSSAAAAQEIAWSAPSLAAQRSSPARKLATQKSVAVPEHSTPTPPAPAANEVADIAMDQSPSATSLAQRTQGQPEFKKTSQYAVAGVDNDQNNDKELIAAPQVGSPNLNGLSRAEISAPPGNAPPRMANRPAVSPRRSSPLATSDQIQLPTTEEDALAPSDEPERNLASDATTPASLRRTPEAMPIDVPFPIGAGGLQSQTETATGIKIPLATPLSEQFQPRVARFVRRDVGRPLAARVIVDMAADAFRRRLRRGETEGGGEGQPPPKTEETIERGLVFLSQLQQPDGRWRLDNSDTLAGLRPTRLHSDTAATGLSLLAFLGAGYHHLDDRYQDHVRRGLEYLVRGQATNGNLYVPDDDKSAKAVAFYSHGIAAIALCEAYGMTNDPFLREPAQRAIDYIRDTQQPDLGGWRYDHRLRESDTSVSGWMLMALKSGELAGLNVSRDTYEKIESWLNLAQAAPDQPHLYRYNPFAPDTSKQGHGRKVTPAMSSVGMLMRIYAGWQRDHQAMKDSAEYLAAHLPSLGSAERPNRDTYYWYYATQVMFHMGGNYWQAWNDHLHPLLVDSQLIDGPLAGSWDPFRPIADRWAGHAGRLYVTTMNLLSLEVYYRHLPLYEDTAK